MIKGVILWNRCHTLFNGFNELTKYKDPDTSTAVLLAIDLLIRKQVHADMDLC